MRSARRSAAPRMTTLLVVLGLLAATLGLTACRSAGDPVPTVTVTATVTTSPQKTASRGTSTPTTRASDQAGAALAPVSPTSSLPTITVPELPAEAQRALALILAGGPFRYQGKDGATFGNRERILPPEPGGYYREYTVDTPGSSDRGARRIVSGQNGSRFYTDDHYQSFREVIQ